MRALSLTLVLFAASALAAQQAPPVHLINAPNASTKPSFGTVAAVRQLPNGRLLVNDVQRRQLVMLDQTLTTPTIIADSVTGGVNSYGPSAGGLIAYYADSSLFIDPRDLSMFVIGPAGNIVRVGAVPRSQDAGMLGNNIVGAPAVDSKGRIVYRSGIGMRMTTAPGKGGPGGGIIAPEFADTVPIVRVDLATRKLDTAAFFKIEKRKMNITQTEGRISMTTEINPMPLLDDFAVVSDGSIAIVRGQDYHVDWVNADGSITTSAKLPYDWQRLSDDDKVAVIDSARTAMERARSAAANAPPGSASPLNAAMATGMVVMNMSVGGEGGTRVASKAGAEGAAGASPLTFITPSELPDYRPVFTAGAAKADIDGNLWIRTTATRTGAIAGPIYDVVNRKGELIDRVQVPAGRVIVGFGKGGVVYMMARDDRGTWLERTTRGGTATATP